MSDQVTIAIHQVVHAAMCGNESMQALQCELVRLYAAAGERPPAILGGYDPCIFDTVRPVHDAAQSG